MSDEDDLQQKAKKKKRRLIEQDNDEKKRETIEGRDSYDKSKFDHLFSGLSIWLEFEAYDDLEDQMKHLQKSCGGEECGVYPFVSHVTILYNIDKKGDEDEKDVDVEGTLKACWKSFKDKDNAAEDTKFEKGKKTKEEESPHTISASDWMYFRYPKSADNGKGFGCSISLLLIEKAPWLEKLHKVCADAFGHGERDKFIPHLSLVYAPEDREQMLVEYTEKQRNKRLFVKEPIPVKYLSLWSTEGRICDWRPILKIPIR